MASAPGKLVLCASIIGVVLAIGSAIAITNAMVQLRHTFLLEAADHAGWEQRFRESSLLCASGHAHGRRQRHKCGRRASDFRRSFVETCCATSIFRRRKHPRGRSELKSR